MSGRSARRGNAAYSNDVFTVQAAGANVWSTADSFNFVSQAVQGFAVEVNGAFTEKARIDLSSTTISNLDVFLIGKPGTSSVTAYYDLNTSGTMTPAGGAITVPVAWFSNNASTARNTSLTGLIVSDGGAAQMAFVYDFFRVDRAVP